ncbi:MAG: STAS domain-containing protein [Planctomycetes bacterium]|jgi:SulP family sulfate permease|nr:STAS domain-containing protein [Planctomycetota bacterium]
MNTAAARVAEVISDRQPWVGLRSLLPASPKAEVLSGLTVALALVPEALAFAFVAGVDPMIGLYSAFFIGLITAVVGGRPGMISGATGAMAVVVVALVAIHGVTYLFPAVILCGLIQISVGLLRLGKLIRMVPHPVMLGFVNGLAIVIGLAQLGSFKRLGEDGLMHFLRGPQLGLMIGLVVLTMAIIFVLPRFTKAVPSSLAAIVAVTLLALAINATAGDGARPVLTVRDMLSDGKKAATVVTEARAEAVGRATAAAAVIDQQDLAGPGVNINPTPTIAGAELKQVIQSMPEEKVDAALATVDEQDVTLSGGLPRPFFLDPQYVGEQAAQLLPPFTLQTLWIILPFALVLAGVGLIESLMTMSLIDEITETRGRGNRECIGQGTANVVCGLFGGMGGCAMIGQSLINVKSGGKGRLSGITAALCLLGFILVLAPLIEMIPMAALVGVMFMVVIGTFEWTTLKTWHRVPISEVLIMVFVAGYTVLMHDLASAVILGVVIAALVYAWKQSTHLFADTKLNEHGSKIYQLHGPLFFASAEKFKRLFEVADDPDDVVIDFYFTRVYDQSGLEAINFIADKYAGVGKRVHLTHLSPECQKLLGRAGDLVEANISEDPHYHVATDRLG